MINSNFLDDAYALLLQQDAYNGMGMLFKGLKERQAVTPPPPANGVILFHRKP